MPLVTATVSVVHMESTERYFANFEIECWNITRTLKIAGPFTVPAVVDASTGRWKQSIARFFPNLVRGTTYSFRARVIPRAGGPPSAWSAWVDETAGDLNAPNPSYSPLVTPTINGLVINANPSGVPADLAFYQWYIRLNNTSPPLSTDGPNFPGPGSVITVVLSDTDVASVYIRAVDTSGNRQAWIDLGDYNAKGGVDVVVFSLINNNFIETFDKPIRGTGASVVWNRRAGSLGDDDITYPLNGQAGGKVIRLAPGVDAPNNQAWLAFPHNIPFDPSKLYRIRARYRKLSGNNSSLIFIGVEGVAADGVTLVNVNGLNSSGSQHYNCVASLDLIVNSQWSVTTSYFKGWAATGQQGTFNSPFVPGKLHLNVRYIRPVFILGHQPGSGLTDEYELDYILIEQLPDNADELADGPTRFTPRIGTILAPDIPYNGDFEQFPDGQDIADGWTKNFENSGTPVFSRSTNPFVGIYAQSVTGGVSGAAGSFASRPFGVKPLARYTFRCRAKINDASSSADGFYFRILFYDDDANLDRSGATSIVDIVNGDQNFFTTNNVFVLASGEVTVPATAKFCRIAIYSWVQPGVARTITIDQMRVFFSTMPATAILEDGVLRFVDSGYVDGLRRPIRLRRPIIGSDLNGDDIFQFQGGGAHNADNLIDGATSPLTGGRRGFNALESNGSGGANGIRLVNTGVGGRDYALRSL